MANAAEPPSAARAILLERPAKRGLPRRFALVEVLALQERTQPQAIGGIPATLTRVVAGLLAKRPAERPQDALQLAAQLRELLPLLKATPEDFADSALAQNAKHLSRALWWLQVRETWKRWAFAAAGVLAAAATGAGAYWGMSQTHAAPQVAAHEARLGEGSTNSVTTSALSAAPLIAEARPVSEPSIVASPIVAIPIVAIPIVATGIAPAQAPERLNAEVELAAVGAVAHRPEPKLKSRAKALAPSKEQTLSTGRAPTGNTRAETTADTATVARQASTPTTPLAVTPPAVTPPAVTPSAVGAQPSEAQSVPGQRRLRSNPAARTPGAGPRLWIDGDGSFVQPPASRVNRGAR
jgi:hypothetical protein